MTAFAVVLELAHRLPLVLALLVFARDPGAGALCAVTAGVLSFARALHRGNAYARALAGRFASAVRAIRRASVQHLTLLRDDREGAHVVVEAAREVAHAESIVRPTMLGEAIALAVLGAAAIVLLPARHVLVGGALGLLFTSLVAIVLRRRRPIERAVWERAAETARDTQVLVESAAQLRAQDAEDRFVDASLARMTTLAGLERRMQAEGALFGAIPFALAGLAALAPDAIKATFQSAGSLAQTGVLGAAVVASAFSLVRAIEAWRRTAPHRAAFDALVGAPPGPSAGDRVRADVVRFDGVTVVHPGASMATPSRLSFELADGGILLEGENGSGKSTALLVLLGLLDATLGNVEVDGRTGVRVDAAYVPQRPFWSEGDSLLWHAQLTARDAVDPADVEAAVKRAELGAELDVRAGRLGVRVPDLRVGSLSGGERQRFLLAWTLGLDRSVIVLDEPEAGLDAHARRWLARQLDQAARRARVLVVAHDPSIVPATFARMTCTRAAHPG